MDELPQLFPQAGRGIGDAHPASPPKLVLEPVLEHVGDAHQVDVHPTRAIAVDVTIAAERLPRDNAPQAGFFLGFADRRVAGPLTVVDRPLRHDPALAPGCRHQRHFDALLADPIGNHRRLLAYPRHPFLLL